MIENPVRGVHYSGSLPQVRAWFGSDDACLDFLDWLRWPDGFVCPWCAGVADWAGRTGRTGAHRCGDCDRHVTMPAGTILHGTRTPLTVWFEAAWLLMSSKQGLSALELQRVTGIGSYQTAWAMLHKLRQAMSGRAQDKLTGRVEVDESYYGGVRPGKRGRGAAGKTLVAAAVEHRHHGYGRIRMRVVDSASGNDLAGFLAATVDAGATIITDGLLSYGPATRQAGMAHEVRPVSGSGLPVHVSLPGTHRVFALSKRVLEGTYQGGVRADRLQAYLDEYSFRFNRRTAAACGLLFLRLLENAVAAAPAPYRSLIAAPRPTRRAHTSATHGTGRPATLEILPVDRPWRTAA